MLVSFELTILIPALIIHILLAFFVYKSNPKSATNIIFGLLSMVTSVWLLINYVGQHPTSIPQDPLFIARLSIFFAVPQILLFFLLAHTIPHERLRLSRNKLYLILFLVGLVMTVTLSPFTFTHIDYTNGSIQPVPGPGMALFSPFAIILSLVSIYTLIKRQSHSALVEKQQLRLMLIGILLMLGLIIMTVLVPVLLFKTIVFVQLAPLYTLIFLGATAYAVIKHRLFDIHFVVARTVAYTLLITIVATFFTGSTFLITSLILKQSTNLKQVLIYAVLTLIVAFTFQRLRKVLQVITDKIFFKADYDSNIFLSNLTKIMAETILIDDIAHQLLKKLIAEMRITRGAFVLTDGGKIFVSETQGYKEEPIFSEKDIFSIQALDKNLIFEDLEESSAKELMRKLNVSVVIPLKTQIDHVGVMLLGEKASGEIYSQKDIKVLEIFAPEASISFENSESVEKIRRFNITLKEQVERATKQLRSANEQLKDLDKLKDEFLSIASHDLRTPMTAIRSYLWMAINGRAGELNPKLKKYLDISYSSAERMITLINDLLNMSRIDAGRVEMNFQDVEFKTIVDQVFAEIAGKASEKAIQLKYEEDKKFPHVILDTQRFPEILQNLVGNAVKFTPEKGTITVRTKRSHEEGFVEISVSDTGVGIPKVDMPKLFSKFGRLDSPYTAVSATGGTGLGLYISKSFVEHHGGKIWVDSVEGKGTTFTFTLRESTPVALKQMVESNVAPQTKPVIPVVK